MAKVVLIHGYAAGLSSVFFPARGEDAGFEAFRKDIADGQAAAFHWEIIQKAKLIEIINFFYLRRLYDREREKLAAIETHRLLDQFLKKESPKVIVCHSMGCLLLLDYLKTFSLPSSIQSIVFVQADVDVNMQIVSSVPIINLHCPWDPTLIASTIYHGHLRAGLLGFNTIKSNKLFPLMRPINLHTSSICDPRLKKFVDTL